MDPWMDPWMDEQRHSLNGSMATITTTFALHSSLLGLAPILTLPFSLPSFPQLGRHFPFCAFWWWARIYHNT